MAEKNNRHRQYETITGWLFIVLLTIATAVKFLNGSLAKGTMGMMTIVLLAGILLYQSRSPRPFPVAFTIIIYSFTYIAVGLGTLGGFYAIHHFDDVLHFLSGVWIGYGSLILLQILAGEDMAARLPKGFVTLYMISFALAAAGLWELFEFAGDKWFHMTAQGRNHDDTMFDMINGLTGGTVAALIYWRKQRS
ncbi:hypothetical protein [Bacillus tuaregi]|uniref:hypothetical protein n=1 Tax=Bacillus tuaregi TaxID=1816695 RepID=UPI0008F7F473|nr:hypothetical protein [Bacillus tuaregi]